MRGSLHITSRLEHVGESGHPSVLFTVFEKQSVQPLGDWVKQSIQLALDRHVTEERNTLLPLGL